MVAPTLHRPDPFTQLRNGTSCPTRTDMRFGIAVVPQAPWAKAVEQAHLVESLGFDVLMTGDHMRHPFDPAIDFLDGWSVLAGWAVSTRHVRLAMYASNLIFRQPVLLVRQAIAVDHISGGRLDLGVGAGIFETDHLMAGVPMWSAAERVARVSEALEILTRLLSGDTADHEGRYYSMQQAAISPGPVQKPRPPIVVGAQGPKMLDLTARFADRWNTFGGYDISSGDEFLQKTAERSRVLDSVCEAIDRDPATLGRSVLVHHSVFDPWSSSSYFERIVHRFAEIGIDELIFYWPRQDQRARFERIALETIPALRDSLL